MYEVLQHPQSPNTRDLDVFYANTTTNDEEKEKIRKTLVKNGAAFVVLGDDHMFLMGIASSNNDEFPQEFTFLPTCFEEVADTETKTQPLVELENSRNKRGLKRSFVSALKTSKPESTSSQQISQTTSQVQSTSSQETSQSKLRNLRERVKKTGFGLQNLQQMFSGMMSSVF